MNIQRTAAREIMASFDQIGVKPPKAIVDGYADVEKLTTAAAHPYTPQVTARAFADALLAGRDPYTDKTVIASIVAINTSQISNSLDEIAYNDFADTCAIHSEAIISAWRKPFADAAATLVAARERIGDIDLADSDQILRLGGDIAKVWASAREADATIGRIIGAWSMLSTLTRQTLDQRANILLRLTDASPARLDQLEGRKLTGWEAVVEGLPLSLPTMDEARARRDAVLAHRAAVAESREQAMKDEYKSAGLTAMRVR